MRNFSLILMILLYCASAEAQDSEKIELGLNDVSVFLPYNEQPKLFELAPRIEPFVSRAILRNIDKTLSDDAPHEDELSVFFRVRPNDFFDYRLVSFRIDPCANQLEVKSEISLCRPEFRLVWQKVDLNRKRFDDNNIHAIHVLSQAEFQEVVAKIRGLKAGSDLDTQKLPLQPNPVIVRDGVESPYFLGMMELVRAMARPDNLREVAFLAETSQGGHWPMLKLEVDGDESRPMIVAGTEGKEDGSPAFVQRMDGRSHLEPPFPLGNTVNNLFRAEDEATVLANAFRLESPSLHSAADTDCASCHRAQLKRDEALDSGAELVVPEEAFRSTRWNLEVKYADREIQSLQIFSYFLTKVRIMPRTINESAAVADFINAHY